MTHKKWILTLSLVVIISLVVFIIILNMNGKVTPTEKTFVIKKGENVLQIAADLRHRGYIDNQIGFIWQALVSGNFRKMKAGTYQIQKGETYEDLIEKFTKAQSASVSISIAPGKTSRDIALILESVHLFKKDEFLDSALNPSQDLLNKFSFLSDKPKDVGLEGYLFPDNYSVDSSETIQEVESQILSNFDAKLTQDLRDEIKKEDRTIFQVVTTASILEKEVINYQDKQIVAGILWKRVDNHLPLEVDSALLYFQTYPHPDVLEKDVDSPYNTYKYAGLPKGPICSPSLDSIKAAIYPKNTDYWFYLSAPDGQTIFAKTLGQQLINKAKYLLQD